MKKLLILSLIALPGTAVSAQTLSGTYEVWRSYSAGFPAVSLEAPQNWYGTDSLFVSIGALFNPGTAYKKQIFKSTDKHGGTYAAMLMTRTQDTGFFGTTPVAMANAKFVVDIASESSTLEGGTPVTQRITKISAWVKHLPKAGDDSAEIDVEAVLSGQGANGTDSVVGDNSIYFGAVNAYTLKDVPINYINPTVTPDKIIIVFNSSDGTDPVDSSVLYVDDVTMTVPSGVELPVFSRNVVTCYPNPGSGTFYLSSTEQEAVTWEAFAADGKIVGAKTFSAKTQVQLDVPAGIYFFRVKDAGGRLVQNGQFTVVH